MEERGPPTLDAQGMAEMIGLIVMFVVGAPLNLAAFTQMSERPVASRLDLLKKHLNYSDLIVIFIYVPSRTCWLLTYSWRGGSMLCSLLKTIHALAFQSSSNIIVCIALDRLLSVLSPLHNCPTRGKSRTKRMLTIAWIIALLISFPQMFVWKSYLVEPSFNWNQCIQIWDIERLENMSIPAKHMFQAEKWYSIAHLLLVFWIPAIIVFACYGIVLGWVWINSRPALKGVPAVQRPSGGSLTGGDTADTLLTRASGQPSILTVARRSFQWNPLRSLSFSRTKELKDDKNMAAIINSRPPQIIVLDDSNEPLNRPSITPSEASAVVRSNVHTGQSYHANINRARALRVSFLLVSAYIICWVPYNLLALSDIFNKDHDHILTTMAKFFNQLIVFNSVLNPYLYGLFGCRPKNTLRRNVAA